MARFITACKLYIQIRMRGIPIETSTIGAIICAERIDRCLKRKHVGGLGKRTTKI